MEVVVVCRLECVVAVGNLRSLAMRFSLCTIKKHKVFTFSLSGVAYGFDRRSNHQLIHHCSTLSSSSM